MQVVILAGGKGTRLRPLTDERPKALVPVCGKPFLQHQLRWAADQGLRDVVLCVGHLADQIEACAGDGASFGVRLTYVHERGGLLGTAGALKHAEALLQEEFCVLNGDSYLPIDVRPPIQAFRDRRLDALMLTYRNDGHYDRSNTAIRDGFVTAYTRTQPHPDLSWIDYGLRVFHKRALAALQPGERGDLDVLYQRLIERRALGAYVVNEPFYEIGSLEGLRRCGAFLDTLTVHAT